MSGGWELRHSFQWDLCIFLMNRHPIVYLEKWSCNLLATQPLAVKQPSLEKLSLILKQLELWKWKMFHCNMFCSSIMTFWHNFLSLPSVLVMILQRNRMNRVYIYRERQRDLLEGVGSCDYGGWKLHNLWAGGPGKLVV